MAVDASHARLALRALLVKIFAWAFIGITILEVVLGGYLVFRPREIVVTAPGSDPGTPPEVIAGMVSGIAFIALVIVTLVLTVVSLVWIYRAHSSLRERGIELTYSAGWAIGSYFVPLVNLVVPFKAMRELYNRSHGEPDDFAHSAVEEVFAWWVAYLVGLSLWMVLLFKMAIDVFTNIVFLTPAWAEFAIWALAALLLALACFLLAKLVGTITEAQAGEGHVASTFA